MTHSTGELNTSKSRELAIIGATPRGGLKRGVASRGNSPALSLSGTAVPPLSGLDSTERDAKRSPVPLTSPTWYQRTPSDGLQRHIVPGSASDPTRTTQREQN